MRTAIGTLASLTILAALTPLTASAHETHDDHKEYGPDQGDVEFTLGAQGANDQDFDAGGFSGATSLGYFFTDWFEIGARHSMTYFDSDTVDGNFAATTRAFADLHLDLDRFQPFVGVNAGVRYGDGDVDETGTIAPEWGIKLFALEKAFVLAMMEYQWFFDDIDDADDRADDGQFVYTLGIGFNF